MPQRPECQIIVESPEVQLGTFANAFRVLAAAGDSCVLDFIVYSAHEGQAAVQTRVRVRRQFLAQIRTALEEALAAPVASPRVHLLN